jgi:hypothetical protein
MSLREFAPLNYGGTITYVGASRESDGFNG